MPIYLIDENMPYYFRLWNTSEYIHQLDLEPKAKDKSIWAYAKENKLTIVTKDADFSERMKLSEPPPRVIHFKVGNISIKEFYRIIDTSWAEACELSKTHKLVNVYRGWVEAMD